MIPAWVDRERYPFDPRALNVGAGTMRYVDEGTGPPIVMVHGTPAWSFLYRDLVMALRDRYRCVVPDQLGFGLSDKPNGASYRPDDQAKRLSRLIDALALKDVTLMVHDFGGPSASAPCAIRRRGTRPGSTRASCWDRARGMAPCGSGVTASCASPRCWCGG